MAKSLRNLTVLVIDNGLFCCTAQRLARDVKKVYYYTPWEESFPRMNRGYIGYGLPEIERVDSIFGKHMDEADLVVFPDIYFGELQHYLVSQGKKCFGPGLGEMLEIRRDGMKSIQDGLDLPVNKWWKLSGIDSLRKFLKSHNDIWVKINKFRGTFESFFSKNYTWSEPRLDEVEQKLGPFKKITEFIVEENLPDRIEVGCDFYTVNGQFPKLFMIGEEIKDKAYVGVVKKDTEFPSWVTDFNTAIAPVLDSFDYSGLMSTELRVGKDKKPYMIDFCARQASPPGELYIELYKNFTDIVWNVANGKIIEPQVLGKYGAEVLIHSLWADKGWQPVQIPKDLKPFIKLRNPTMIDGSMYVIPQSCGLPEIGAVIGWGDSYQEAVDMCKDIAKEIEGFYLDVQVSAFDDVEEELEKADKMGLSWI
jgi:hypothetical protein